MKMKKITIRIFAVLLILCALPATALAAQTLVPVGRVIGLELKNGTVSVAGFAEGSCAKAAGLQEGDCIEKIDQTTITCAQDVRTALTCSGGRVRLTVRRGQEKKTLELTPDISADGPKLGVYLKEGVTGIGTVTFWDPQTGEFAALGHGVNSPGGELLRMTEGSAFGARVMSVRKGKTGQPGQLLGSITTPSPIARLEKNTAQGVFGNAQQSWQGTALPVGESGQVRTGKATILSNISGQDVQEYSVEILKIYAGERKAGRNLLLRVTDSRLLEATGGIVQGMSGSPIIQDGKLVGAVTHVLVNDPATGYGIFIENMLDAAA